MNSKLIAIAAMTSSLLLGTGCGDDDTDMMGSGGTSGASGSSGRNNSGASGSSTSGLANGGMAGTGNDTGEPLGEDNPPKLGAQIDRAGRPAISTALVATFETDEDVKNSKKDAYNAADDPTTWAEDAEADLMTNLAILDSLDSVCGNQLLADGAGARYEALAGVLLDDQLYVNTASGTCEAYLGVEAEALGLVEDGGCGGRTPNYDVIERSYSVLAAGALTGVDDTIPQDDQEHSLTEFPFIAP
jgi:hypothetical protein